MIKTLFFLGLTALAMAEEHKSSWPPNEHLSECQKDTGATDADVEDLTDWKVPHTETGVCFYGCIFQKIHYLKDDHTFDEHEMEKLIENIKQSKNPKYIDSRERYIHMFKTCPSEANKHTPNHDDPRASCIAAKHFTECVAKELEHK